MSYYEGTNWQARKEDEKKPLFENESKKVEYTKPSAGEERITELEKVLRGYEQWEADLIGDNRCWGPEGMNSNPVIVSDLWDKLIDLQGQRNKALKASPSTNKQSDEGLKDADYIIELKEKERKEWADMCIKKQARIELLEGSLSSILEHTEKYNNGWKVHEGFKEIKSIISKVYSPNNIQTLK